MKNGKKPLLGLSDLKVALDEMLVELRKPKLAPDTLRRAGLVHSNIREQRATIILALKLQRERNKKTERQALPF